MSNDPSAIAAIGIDAGSTTSKVAAIDANNKLIAWQLVPTKPRINEQIEDLITSLANSLDMSNDELNLKALPSVATGYGRKLVEACQSQVTEITCHAKGVFTDLNQTGTLIDIGGQDSKVIVIGPKGKAVDFVMNDKCAAGTGRFLEHTAARLEVEIEELGERALSADHAASISSTCTVFAESEIISLLANGVDVDVILAGLHKSLVSRIVSMVKNVGFRPPLMLSGGVSKNIAIQKFLGDALHEQVKIPAHPQLMGAYGAALIALERANSA